MALSLHPIPERFWHRCGKISTYQVTRAAHACELVAIADSPLAVALARLLGRLFAP